MRDNLAGYGISTTINKAPYSFFSKPNRSFIDFIDGNHIVDDFITQVADISLRTAIAYRPRIQYFLNWIEEQGIQEPSKVDFQTYRNELIEESIFKPSTINVYLSAVRQFFRYMSDMGLYPDIAATVANITVQAVQFRASKMSKDELDHLLRFYFTHDIDRFLPMFLLIGIYRLSRTQLCSLLVSDLHEDPVTGTYYLETAAANDEIGIERVNRVYLDSITLEALQDYIASKPEPLQHPSMPIFTQKKGDTTEKLNSKALGTHLKRGFERASLPYINIKVCYGVIPKLAEQPAVYLKNLKEKCRMELQEQQSLSLSAGSAAESEVSA